MAAIGNWVAFRVVDVYLPGSADVLRGLDEHTVLLGRLIGFSDSGPRVEVFSVVELAEGGQTVIISTEKLAAFDIRENPDKEDAG